jgi:hypothetical protein
MDCTQRKGNLPQFLAGDVLLFAGQGDLYSRVGGWLMRGAGDGPTYCVHTAQVLDSWRVLEMDMVARIKTVDEVLRKGRGFELWRCVALTPAQRAALTREARTYLNARFGWATFFANLLDDLISKLVHKDVILFRRSDPDDRHPVCSGITATVYARVLHYRFGAPPQCADPDQISDWVRAHPGEWVQVVRREAQKPERTPKVAA